MKFFLPIILIVLAVMGFFVFVEPMFAEIKEIRAESLSYNKALDNSKALENTKDKLSKIKSDMNPADVQKLEKMLPADVDNIRLIVEIQNNIAAQHGLFLRDIQYNLEEKENGENVITGGTPREKLNRDYGEWGLQFSIEGTYSNFILFLRDLEKNLRLVDVVSIDFSSGSINTKSKEDVYKYSFKIKTYWLKN